MTGEAGSNVTKPDNNRTFGNQSSPERQVAGESVGSPQLLTLHGAYDPRRLPGPLRLSTVAQDCGCVPWVPGTFCGGAGRLPFSSDRGVFE